MSDEVVGSALVRIGGDDTPLMNAMRDMQQKVSEQIGALGIITGGALYPIVRGIQGLFDVATSPLRTLGSMVSSVWGPVADAIKTPLTDFRAWVDEAIEAQAAQVRFNAVLKNTGDVVGWTAQQLKAMRLNLSESTGFSARDFQEAQKNLLQMQGIRGDNFRQTLQVAADMAAAMPGQFGGVADAARMLGRALEDPARGMMLLHRTGVFLTDAQQEQIKAMRESGNVAGAQAALLDAVSKSFSGTAAAMLQTTQGQLGLLTRSWNSIGKAIGEALEPATGTLARFANVAVTQLGRVVKPLIDNVGEGIKSFADRANSWLESNRSTFEKWGTYLQIIVGNVWDFIKDKFSEVLPGLDANSLTASWTTFSDKITSILETVGAYSTAINEQWDNFTGAVGSLWDQVKSGALSAFDSLRGTLGKVFDEIAVRFGERLKTALLTALADLNVPFVSEGARKSLEHARNAADIDAQEKAFLEHENGGKEQEGAAPVPVAEAKKGFEELMKDWREKINQNLDAERKKRDEGRPTPSSQYDQATGKAAFVAFDQLAKQIQEAVVMGPSDQKRAADAAETTSMTLKEAVSILDDIRRGLATSGGKAARQTIATYAAAQGAAALIGNSATGF